MSGITIDGKHDTCVVKFKTKKKVVNYTIPWEEVDKMSNLFRKFLAKNGIKHEVDVE